MTRKPSITLKDIALAAGVTPMAVSVALNGSHSRSRVSEATRQRITSIAESLGYQANAIARSLHRRHTNIIGLWSGRKVFNADSPFTAVILAGLQVGCAENGKDLLLHGALHHEPRTGLEVAYSELSNGKIDGAVVDADPLDPLIAKLGISGLPLVAICELLEGIPSVVVDDAAAGRLLCAHLHARGHRRVLWRNQDRQVLSQESRREAFRTEAVRLGMVLDESVSSYDRPDLSADEHALLDPSRRDRASAVVGFADHAVHPVLDELDRLGWRIPAQVAVAGFDGLRMFMEPTPRHDLTTVVIPWREVARQAVGLLAQQISGKEVPLRTILPVELRIGDTT